MYSVGGIIFGDKYELKIIRVCKTIKSFLYTLIDISFSPSLYYKS